MPPALSDPLRKGHLVNTILIVEDEALIADDIQRTLVRLGYDVPTPCLLYTSPSPRD